LVKRGALENRLEPFYYVPSIVELENKIREIANGKLNDYALKMSSGATPLKSEEEKYYSNAENGIPFIRVQNLNDTNELSLDDLKYINYETHQNDLKRSQVTENDLLVKITGVGRMAVACVPPLGFEGNTNQHLVVIKTKDRLTSETLATYLNSDIVEKLASRRSTGGTRPALDYTSLKSIPVIFKTEIVDLMKKAVENKLQKETEAKQLLASIDAYLLEQLGIILPDKIEEKNVFYVPFSKVQGNRFDPFYHKDEFEINDDAVLKGKYKVETIKEICKNLIKGRLPKDSEKGGSCKVVQINSVKIDGSIDLEDLLTAKPIFTQNQLLQENDVLIVITGATIGKISFWQYEGEYYLGGDIVKFQCNEGVNPYYIYSYLRTQIIQTEIKRNITGATNGHLSPGDINNFQIPLPPLEIQTEIANHIQNIRERAKTLEIEAKEVIEKAKAEVEKMILGE
jgi:restriction endonuclease S subunit